MNTITFENLTAQEVDDFNEFITSAISGQLRKAANAMTNDQLDAEVKDRQVSYHLRLADSFESIVKKMKVDNGTN